MANRTYKPHDMFPLLHDAVNASLSDEMINPPSFNPTNTSANTEHEYSTNIMGSFDCNNNSCKKRGWNSKVVAIVIRLYYGNEYNAVVYNQRCKACNQLGSMAIDEESYVERISYRLKKWADMEVERPVFTGPTGKPHETAFCEGCKQGVCRKGAFQY